MHAVMEFENYYIDKIKFENNDAFSTIADESDHKMDVRFELEVGIDDSDQNARIMLTVVIGAVLNDKSILTVLEVRAVGFFKQDGSMDTNKFREMCERNGTAILFPFLRSAVADVTRITNMGTPLILPLVNTGKLFLHKTTPENKE